MSFTSGEEDQKCDIPGGWSLDVGICKQGNWTNYCEQGLKSGEEGCVMSPKSEEEDQKCDIPGGWSLGVEICKQSNPAN